MVPVVSDALPLLYFNNLLRRFLPTQTSHRILGSMGSMDVLIQQLKIKNKFLFVDLSSSSFSSSLSNL